MRRCAPRWRRGRPAAAPRRRGGKKLLKLEPALWTFARQERVEPTNNAAERALRPLVLKRKISGPTRSRRGDQFLSYGYTAYETCRRQGRDLWHFMHGAVHALIAGTAPPSLIPQAAPTG